MTGMTDIAVKRRKKDVCACILAHNEQKHIASTIKAIIEGNRDIVFDVVVYANGCTDDTVTIVKHLFNTFPNLRLRELKKASKPLAWNTAFQENEEPILIFSDGDVAPEAGSILALCNSFKKNDAVMLASCQYWPQNSGLFFGQKVTGFLQIPLAQDFLTGCFYAVKKNKLEKKFAKIGTSGIPDGIVGEDFFLENLVPEQNFTVIEKKCYYEPPGFEDYWKYLARIQWQEEQIALFFDSASDTSIEQKREILALCKKKLSFYQGIWRLFLGLSASIMRRFITFLYSKNIKKYYQALGPVVPQGSDILGSATRSTSVK